jgi:cellulose synthase/poly-beta-1,6-N-acetylglucosamine synthase-like glycosyltransferase
MVSVIITSWKEPKTIGKAIQSIADTKYSGIPEDFEIVQTSPDDETLQEGLKQAKKMKLGNKYKQVRDPLKGKPYALEMVFKIVKGDFVVLTDGDVFFDRSAVKKLLAPFKNPKVWGVSGRPKSSDPRDYMMGYWGHLLVDAADYHRKKMLNKTADGYYISGKNFFPMSGYIHAVRHEALETHPGSLAEDAYISYQIRNKGYEIAYVPDAVAYVKFPTNLKDYYLQKVRSVGGYMHLKRFGATKRDKQSRNLFIEIPYTFYALFQHPKNLREIWWAFLMHPVRLYMWLVIFWRRVILRQGMPKKGWERIESTK